MVAASTLTPESTALEFRSDWHPGSDPAVLISQEWLVTNGLGGYASGTVRGISTRRYHGLFIPNLPSPRGRTVFIPRFDDAIEIGDRFVPLGGAEVDEGTLTGDAPAHLTEFKLVWQKPHWTFEIAGRRLEKRIFMPYGQNTVYAEYKLASGGPLSLVMRPFLAFREHDGPLGNPPDWPFTLTIKKGLYEVVAHEDAPPLRLGLTPANGVFVSAPLWDQKCFYRVEKERGLDDVDSLSSPGYFSIDLEAGQSVAFFASIEPWESLTLDAPSLFEAENHRLRQLLAMAPARCQTGVAAQLVLAADQFIVLPGSRTHEKALGEASGEHRRTVIAGYHWFTDWGRDTMISFEGLALCTGRFQEAREILRTFASYVKDGLLPNLFPEGQKTALYHTVDATFWFFHAMDRYVHATQDHDTLRALFPTFKAIIEAHLGGTHFGIRCDADDGLIKEGEDGYALTWMDAKVANWVVTPRRGKPVEIQALWYNALRLFADWSALIEGGADTYTELAQRAFDSFNRKFWNADGRCLYDVIEGPDGVDASIRPNQVFSLSLQYPILATTYWRPMLETVTKHLLTPLGLRTLDAKNPYYKPHYQGDRWARDSAYHQGLVWAWLIGPYLDARQRVYPGLSDRADFLRAFSQHLKEAGFGTISEIFDADEPFTPRGCIAQAWSVAEVLRSFAL